MRKRLGSRTASLFCLHVARALVSLRGQFSAALVDRHVSTVSRLLGVSPLGGSPASGIKPARATSLPDLFLVPASNEVWKSASWLSAPVATPQRFLLSRLRCAHVPEVSSSHCGYSRRGNASMDSKPLRPVLSTADRVANDPPGMPFCRLTPQDRIEEHTQGSLSGEQQALTLFAWQRTVTYLERFRWVGPSRNQRLSRFSRAPAELTSVSVPGFVCADDTT